MGQETDTELQTAWKALAVQNGKDGWQTIRIAHHLDCHVLAARQNPGNTEALLVGFPSSGLNSSERLPDGHGFALRRVNLGVAGQGLDWYNLTRQPAADMHLFGILAEDLLEVLSTCSGSSQAHSRFIKRIWAWLAFMKRSPEGVLSRETEIGLFGELIVLRQLVTELGIPANLVVEAWTGPLECPQDFTPRKGALEVKTQVSPGRPHVAISSLEQLDDATISPLFLSLVTLLSSDNGDCLPDLINSMREILVPLPNTLQLFNDRLMCAGYLDAMASRYDRTYIRDQIKVFPIDSSFPCLKRSVVASDILDASYTLGLNNIMHREVPFPILLPMFQVS